jgi:hypothetical protein
LGTLPRYRRGARVDRDLSKKSADLLALWLAGIAFAT